MRTNHAMLHSMLAKVTLKKYSIVKITGNEHS